MATDTTIDNCRKLLYSDLFDAKNLGTWQSEGESTKETKAWNLAKKLIDNFDYELEESKRNEVEKIYQKAVKMKLK